MAKDYNCGQDAKHCNTKWNKKKTFKCCWTILIMVFTISDINVNEPKDRATQLTASPHIMHKISAKITKIDPP